MNVFAKSAIDASVLAALITFFTFLYNGTVIMYGPGVWHVTYGYPIAYYSEVTSFYFSRSFNFFSFFTDFAFWFAIVFPIVSLLSVAFRKLTIRKKGLISFPEIEQRKRGIEYEDKHSLFYIRMNERNTLKVIRLIFIHNLAMTFLWVLILTISAPPYLGYANDWVTIFTNAWGIVSWIYWIAGTCLIFIYSRHLDSSRALTHATSVLNK